MQTLDLEGTQHLSIGKVDALVGMGLRYAMLRQTFNAAITDPVNPVSLLTSERRFEGFGPILNAEFYRPLGQTGFAGFGILGGGILFGNKSMRRTVLNGVDPLLPPFISMDNVDEVTGMGQLQVGLEWTHCSRLGRFFVRGAYEGQLWTDAGAPTLTFLGFEGLVCSLGLVR